MKPVRPDPRPLLAVALAAACATPAPPSPPPAPPPAAPAAPAAPPVPEGHGRLITAPVEGSRSVAFRLMFYTGSSDDPRGKEGLTALTARLVAEGGTALRTYPELSRLLYPMAAAIEVDVDVEQTVFRSLVHAERAAELVPLLAEVLTRPRLDAADLERLRKDAIDDLERRLKSTDDENLGKALLQELLWSPDHPYGHPVGGTVAGLRSITLEDVKAHAARVFGRRRLLVGVGGAVDPALTAQLTAALEALPEGAPRLELIPPAPPLERTRVVIAEKPTSRAVAISIGFAHGATRGHPDFPALGLVQSYFGEHRQFHGVLMQQIRARRGINYGDYAYVESFLQEGGSRNARTSIARRRQHFELWLRPVAPADLGFTLRLALLELRRLVEQGVPAEAVASTRDFLQGYTRLWEVSPTRRLGHALDDAFYGTDRWLDAYRAALAGLDADAVNQAMRRHLVPGPLHVAIVAPDAYAVKQALLAPPAAPRTYPSAKPEALLAEDRLVEAFDLGLDEESVRIVPAAELFLR